MIHDLTPTADTLTLFLDIAAAPDHGRREKRMASFFNVPDSTVRNSHRPHLRLLESLGLITLRGQQQSQNLHAIATASGLALARSLTDQFRTHLSTLPAAATTPTPAQPAIA